MGEGNLLDFGEDTGKTLAQCSAVQRINLNVWRVLYVQQEEAD